MCILDNVDCIKMGWPCILVCQFLPCVVICLSIVAVIHDYLTGTKSIQGSVGTGSIQGCEGCEMLPWFHTGPHIQ